MNQGMPARSSSSGTSQKLQLLQQVLDGVAPQIDQTQEESYSRRGGKEQATATFSPENQQFLQQIEVEPTPELSPEVESYLQHVEDHADTAPHEIVIAEDQSIQTKPLAQNQKMILLPLTEEEHNEGVKKNPTWSIKWLITFGEKLMKIFPGQTVYKDSK